MNPTLIPLAAILLPAFLAPTLVVLKQRHQKRHWQHLERMKAIACGVPVPALVPAPGSGPVIAIGAGVPALAIISAFIATMRIEQFMPHALERTAVVWAFALIISMCGMASSLVFFVLQHRAHAKANAIAEAASSYTRSHFDSAKPAYDPDAFDVASRRG